MKSINLLPAKQKTSSRNPQLMPLLLLIVILLLGAQLYYVLSWKSEGSGVEQERLRLEQEIDQIRKSGDLKVKVDGYRQAEQILAGLEQSRIEWKPYLKAIVGHLPSTSKIVTISVADEPKVSMELDFKTASDVIIYMQKLEAEEVLKDVVLTSYFKKVDGQTSSEVVASGTTGETTIKTVRKEVYKLMLDIVLADAKGAQSDGTQNEAP
ncbi:hypothetical protein [Paenibacillus sinopodophylli]|uniref:hypothetical protein n=1 Tax=Paenibacillus sinopodophylli TaxID=1837342 RepID=UPI00110CE008|nr:hypothetical protein [Paenibacillus sinopodophylli]